MSDIHHYKEAFRKPLEDLTGLPNCAYISTEFAEFERDHVITKTWFCIANEAQFPEDGWVLPVDILGLPLLAVKGRDGAIRVFHNVCSHRGMKLIETAGAMNGVMTCRYHGWCYGAEGELRATPHINGEGQHEDDSFDRSLHGLKQIRSAVFCGMLFVNLSNDAIEFDEFIRPVTDRWHEFDLNQYRHGGDDSHWEITLNSNWKLAQENHVDGYHLPFVHPGLHSYSPLSNHYPLLLEGCASGQGSKGQNHESTLGATELPLHPNLHESWYQGRAEFLSVFPNVMMSVQADHTWTVQLIPVSADVTIERMDLRYYGPDAVNPIYHEPRLNNRNRMLEIFEEDRDMVEGMQRGRQSPVFTGGALAPNMDQPAHCFNRIIAQAVLDALETA